MWNESLYNMYFTMKDKYNDVYKSRFTSENSYHFNFTINGKDAFFYLHKDICKLISDISFLDKEVESLINSLPGEAKNLYIKKSLIDEVLYTNEIEGVISTRKEIDDIIDNITNKSDIKPNKITSLVKKYLILLDNTHELLTNPSDVRKIYDELVLDEILDYDANDKPDGIIFRANSVELKNEVSGNVIHEGVMPEAKIIEYMSLALNLINDETVIPLVRIAAFHYIFSYIHPFYDGNGRTNRFISSLYLKKYYSSIIPFRLSLTIKENKKQYYEAFDKTNSPKNYGDITTFIYEFVDIVKKSYSLTSDYLKVKYNELIEKQNYIKESGLDKNEEKVLWYLSQIQIFKSEYAKISDICKITDLSNTTARKVLTSLLKKDLIIQAQESKFKTYIAK